MAVNINDYKMTKQLIHFVMIIILYDNKMLFYYKMYNILLNIIFLKSIMEITIIL